MADEQLPASAFSDAAVVSSSAAALNTTSEATGLQTVVILLAVGVAGVVLFGAILILKRSAREKKRRLWDRYQKELKQISLPMSQTTERKSLSDQTPPRSAPRPGSSGAAEATSGNADPTPSELEAGGSHFSDSSDESNGGRRTSRLARKLTPSMLAKRKSKRHSIQPSLPAPPAAAAKLSGRPPDYQTSMAQHPPYFPVQHGPPKRSRPDPTPLQRPRGPIPPRNSPTPPKPPRSRAATPFGSDESPNMEGEHQVDLDDLALSDRNASDD